MGLQASWGRRLWNTFDHSKGKTMPLLRKMFVEKIMQFLEWSCVKNKAEMTGKNLRGVDEGYMCDDIG